MSLRKIGLQSQRLIRNEDSGQIKRTREVINLVAELEP
jgi:hypothetical protein